MKKIVDKKIEKYYLELIDKAVLALTKGELISFVGMYDCGRNYLYSLLVERLEQDKITKEAVRPVFVELHKGGLDSFLREVSVGLALETGFKKEFKSEDELIKDLVELSKEKRIGLLINVGYGVSLSAEVLALLLRLRNLLRWRFVNLFFANCGFLFPKVEVKSLFEKVCKKNVCEVLPLNETDSGIVVDMYEEKYGKVLSKKLRGEMVSMAGGNPGFLKILYLQLIEDKNWETRKILDERFFYRLNNLVMELPGSYRSELEKACQGDLLKAHGKEFLKQFGYVNKKGEVFSPLIGEYFKLREQASGYLDTGGNVEEAILLKLSLSERRLYAGMREKNGEVISRDKVAELLWRSEWEERYSDWAIDQVISSLRKKLKDIEDAGDIYTKRGEGYILKLPRK